MWSELGSRKQTGHPLLDKWNPLETNLFANGVRGSAIKVVEEQRDGNLYVADSYPNAPLKGQSPTFIVKVLRSVRFVRRLSPRLGCER